MTAATLPESCPKCGSALAQHETLDTATGKATERWVSCENKDCNFSRGKKPEKS
jgi:hypothetical protein